MSLGSVDTSSTTGGRPRRRGTLSREGIIAMAIEVIDARGVSGLTMRNLGQALGVDAMSVYGYFENKADLLDAVVEDQAVRLTQVPPPHPTDPIEFIVHLGLHYRKVLLEHPNMAPLVAARPLPQSSWSSSVSFGVGVFRAAGFDDAIIPLAADAMVMFSLGFIVHEAGQVQLRSELGEDREHRQAELRRQLDAIGSDATVEARVIAQRLGDEQSVRAMHDEQFEAGLRAMLLGLRDGLGSRPA